MDTLILLLALSFADYEQSAQMFSNQGYYEINPILGTHPRNEQMALFGVVGVTLSYYADKALTPKSHLILDSITTSELWNVEQNNIVWQGQERTQPIMFAVTIRF